MSCNDDPARDHPPITGPRLTRPATPALVRAPSPRAPPPRRPMDRAASRHMAMSRPMAAGSAAPSPTAKMAGLGWHGAGRRRRCDCGHGDRRGMLIDALGRAAARRPGVPWRRALPGSVARGTRRHSRRVRERDAEDERCMAGLRARPPAASHDPAARPRRGAAHGFA